jgi:hypothetical protein
MAMRPFFDLVDRRHAHEETRSISLPEGTELPADEYAFIEFYCDDPKCDCRRVIFQVWRKSTRNKVWATITYGWETPEYYAQWSHGPGLVDPSEMASAVLEQISPQTELSAHLLQLCKNLLLSDENYVARLKRHYHEACPGRKSLTRPEPLLRRDPRLLSPINRRRLREMKRRRR